MSWDLIHADIYHLNNFQKHNLHQSKIACIHHLREMYVNVLAELE